MHRSVPPLSEPSGIASETCSATQRKPAAGSGAPVEPTPRSAVEVLVPARLEAGRAAGHQERGAHAEVRGARLGRQPPQRREIGPGGVAVEQHDRRADREPRHEVVPHHPAGRREPAEAVRGPEVRVEGEGLQVLEEDAAVPVDDRLREAGGPRREEDVERVVERDGVEGEGRRIGEERRPGHGVRGRRRGRPAPARRYGHDDRGPQGRQRGPDLGDRRGPVDVPVAVAVAVDREQDGGLDLGEPVDDGPRAELGRARRPDGAEGRGREQADHGLRDVGQERGHAVAAPDAESLQARPAACDGVAELVGGEVDRVAGLRPADHDDVGRVPARHREHVVRVVERRTREPARARHPGLRQRGSRRRRGPHAEMVPDRLPEGARLVDRPAPGGVVVRRTRAPARSPARRGSGPIRVRSRASPGGLQRTSGIGSSEPFTGRLSARRPRPASRRSQADKLRGGSVRSRLVAVPVKVSTLRRTFCHASGSSIASAEPTTLTQPTHDPDAGAALG